MKTRLFLIPLYFVSVFLLPWWVTVLLSLALIAYLKAYASALIGAVILDTIYGTSLAFGGVYLYTATMLFLVIIAYVLRGRLLE